MIFFQQLLHMFWSRTTCTGFEQTTAGVMGNDFDREGDPLTVSRVNSDPAAVGVATLLPSGALITLNADGSFFYDTNSAFDWVALGDTTTDVFTYQVDDGNGNTNSLIVIDE